MAAKIIDPYGFLVYISVTSASGPSITCHDEKTWDYNTFLMSQSSLPLEMVPQAILHLQELPTGHSQVQATILYFLSNSMQRIGCSLHWCFILWSSYWMVGSYWSGKYLSPIHLMWQRFHWFYIQPIQALEHPAFHWTLPLGIRCSWKRMIMWIC